MSRSLWLSVPAVWLLLTTPLSLSGGPVLELVARGGIVWSLPVRADERFDLRFEHSQERTPWVQHYRVGADGAIWQDGSTFGSYGAGMPLLGTHRRDDGFRAEETRRISVIRMLSSAAADIRVDVQGRSFAVAQWLDDYEPFVIQVR